MLKVVLAKGMKGRVYEEKLQLWVVLILIGPPLTRYGIRR
jgi:hypothetical protein